MNKNKIIKTSLASATLALLTQPALSQQDTDSLSSPTNNQTEQTASDYEWKFDAALLFYSESDSRVQAFEPVFMASKQLDEDESISFKLTVDSLTGASPSGAVASNQVQTFTTPSGNADYQVGANVYPLDDSFKDTRVALAANWSFPLAESTQMTVGANASNEYDYFSASVNANISHDFNNNNTTLFAGLSFASDTIDPVGGAPIALSRMQPVGASQAKLDGTQDKDTLDILFGMTQVIDKYSLFQLNYSYSMSDGYHNDPYKVLSVLGADGNYFDDGIATANVLFENRPDKRTKHSLFGRYKRFIDGDVVDVSYRYMTDDWDIDSHTVDLKYRFALNNDSYIQPHVRYYTQTAAEFYQPYLLQAQALPTYASADYRLAEYDAVTVGLEYGWTTQSDQTWRIALEYYAQSPTEPAKFGVLQDQTLLPDWNAVMLRINYSF
ncbi:MAG: DUF3570 domain-containing protein [Kangiellaceae bacterium]|nr:DUF3570 domain-containing protein [Kangiellaceae bacterium]